MGSGPKPTPPDQLEAMDWRSKYRTNQLNTISQNANRTDPFGTTTNKPGARIPIYDENGRVTGYGTQWSQNYVMSPAQKAIFDEENKAKLGLGQFANRQIGTLKNVLGKPFNTAGLPAWQRYGAGPDLVDPSKMRNEVEQKIAESHRRNMAPGREAEAVQMAARGAMPGSEMDYMRTRRDADVDAEAYRGGYLASLDESRAMAEAMNKERQQEWLNANTRVDQSNATRQGMFGERQTERNQIVNELAALLGGAQATVSQIPAFVGSMVNPFDIAGTTMNYDNLMAKRHSDMMSGLFGLGGNALSLAFGL